MKKIYSFLLALLGLVSLANAQSQLGEIRGKVIDSKTKKPMDYVSITIELNGIVKATTLSDDDGSYIVKTLQPGEYTVKATNIGYMNTVISSVNVISDQITFVNVTMESSSGGKELGTVYVTQKKQLVDPEGKGGGNKTAKEIMASPQRNVNSLAGTVAGVDSRAGATPNIRGARADGTAYYIDGVRVQGNASTNIPQYAIDQVQVITGGTPAQYGDFVGGAIAINTKAPSRNWQRAFEYVSSSPFNKTLDNSNYNELNAFVSGPIKIVNAGKGDKERVLVGFSFSGLASYYQDPRLPATDVYKVKDQKQQQINNNPLVPQASGGFIPAGEYLVKSDLQKIDYRLNANNLNLVGQGNFSFQPANNMTVRLGYQGTYFKGRDYSYSNSLMNYSNNGLREDYTVRAYLQFTQNFSSKKTEEEAKKSLVSNAFYTVRVSYERRGVELSDAEFGRDFFRYGYVGKLTNYNAPVYNLVAKQFGDSADVYRVLGPNGKDSVTLRLTSPYWKQTGSNDTLLTFQQSNDNQIRGNYTREVFDYYGEQGSKISSVSQLRGLGGLANGDNPVGGVYSNMWNSPGTQQVNIYQKFQNEAIQLYVMSEASVAPSRNPKSKHDLQFGFFYEQQFTRSYQMGATGLWTLMRQYVNSQFGGPDSSKASATFDQNGVFQDTIKFKDLIVASNQSTFDKNLRAKLISMGARDAYGNPITNETKLSPDAYDPSIYSLNMFSASELLNNGNSSVSYYGYDYLGNRVSGKQGVNKFLNDPTNRTIGAYQPIYTAAWIQDKFVFKDLIVRLGLRMERFDANQPVLKDPYSMAPIYTAGDVRRGTSEVMKTLANAIPGSVGDNYAVYVNSENQEGVLKVSGFRQGNNWYDRNGNPVTDPNALWKSSVEQDGASINRNTPYLVTPGQKLPTAESFKDYTPDLKFLPRVWFSFPISTTSQFFGTYDVLAQRPTQLTNVFQIDDYYYLINRQGNILNNPDLKMQQVTDYEIGFRQQIGNDAALGIIASYREFRNQIQQYQYNQAWPYNYTSYSNIDFSTVKSIRLEYDLRDIGNINLNASYTLQYANGTGSTTSSGSALIQAGLPTQRNVFPMDFDTRHTLKGVFDYHYKDGKDYNGPIVGGKKIFENAGLNLIFNFVSGRPYTQTTTPTPGDAPSNQTQPGSVQRSQVKGTINGANLPSQFFADLNVDKNFLFRSEGLDGKTTTYRLRIYLQVQNLFNNINVLTVYRYTGSGYTDGYLTSPQAKASIQSATSAQSFVDLYNARVVNPNNFALPRLTRIGLALYF